SPRSPTACSSSSRTTGSACRPISATGSSSPSSAATRRATRPASGWACRSCPTSRSSTGDVRGWRIATAEAHPSTSRSPGRWSPRSSPRADAGSGTPEAQPRYTARMADTSFPPAIESPLVVVSNRGPVTFERSDTGGFRAERGAGGLVTTLSGVFYRDEATWVSAAVSEADREGARRLALDEATDLRLRFVSLDPKIYDGYYNGISNGILWFTHHYLWDIARTPVFDETTDDAWHSYEEANRAFADALDGFPQDAVFLIQDYQLALVPMYLREHRPDARIIHFSHTPFAGHTYLRLLPIGMREALLRGMAAADVIGFQSRTWAENFLLSTRGIAGSKADLRRSRLTLDGTTSLVRTFPVSVGVEGLRAMAATPQVAAIRDEIRSSLGDQRLLLRVDRLEPSKNILRGYLAYELFLRRNPG